MVNLIKFATGLDPHDPSVLPGQCAVVGEYFEFTYTRSKAAKAELTFTVTWSDTLEADSWSDEDVTETEVIDQGTTELVTVSIPKCTTGQQDRRYLTESRGYAHA